MRRIFLFCIVGIASVSIAVSFARAQTTASARDAVGVRIFKNPDGNSVFDWYVDQCANKVFLKCGKPKAIMVDGYDGLRDGNTVYVNAANVTGGTLYTNIYLISLSEQAGKNGTAVFDQLLQHWKFNTNLPGIDANEKLRRDVRRRAHLQSLRRSLKAYKADKGRYPDLASGTYVRNISFSAWPSWQQTLGAALGGTIPVDQGRRIPDPEDPKKSLWQNMVGCASPYDPVTCWDARASTMQCPLATYAYVYRFDPATSEATVTTTYESATIPSGWIGDKNPSSWTGLCSVRGGSAEEDGDRDAFKDAFDNCPSVSNNDQRDSDGDRAGDACDACPFDDRNDSDGDGKCANVDSCPTTPNIGRDSDGDGVDDACDSLFCGNGRKDVGEECDGSAGVGAHERCTVQCTLIRSTYCGDTRVQNPNDEGVREQCEGAGTENQACTTSTGYRGTQQRTCAAASCTWGGFNACTSTERCGDSIRNGGEQCDNGAQNSDTVSVGYGEQKNFCTTTCQTRSIRGPYCGDSLKNGSEQCDGAQGVGPNQTCVNCTLQNLTYCGDGIVQNPNNAGAAEQCDGTAGVGANQQCQSNCTIRNLSYCGDGRIQNPNDRGVAEQCDGTAGVGTGQRCTTSCTLESTNFCGDGVIGGTEQCDGSQLGGASCTTLGWRTGVLGCDATCRYYGSGCAQGDLSVGDIRIKAIWPSVMRDLDSYLVVPTPTPTKVYHARKGSVLSDPFAALSWDDTGGTYGETPGTGMEIMTIVQHSGAYYPGTYKFYMYNNSGVAFAGQDVRIDIYVYDSSAPGRARKVKSYTTRTLSGSGQFWYAFDITNGIITDKNVLQSAAP